MALTLKLNTYATVAYADTYNGRAPFNAKWGEVEVAQKERLLRLATRLLDEHFTYLGVPTSFDQPLAFPRFGVCSRQGKLLSSTTIPAEISDACSELAFQLSLSELTDEQILADLDIRRSGETAFGGGAIRRVIPSVVVDMIPETIRERRPAGTGMRSIPLERV